MKCLITILTALFGFGFLAAEESPDSLMQRMLRHLQEPHSYEIALDKRDNQIPEIRLEITKNNPRFHARVYRNNTLAGEEIFDGTTRYAITPSDSSVICTDKLAPGDANLYLLDLDDLGLAYVDVTDEAAKCSGLRQIGAYPADDPTGTEQPLIVYSIDPVGPVPVSLWWSAEGRNDLFRNFKFGIAPASSEFTLDRDATKGYTVHDYR